MGFFKRLFGKSEEAGGEQAPRQNMGTFVDSVQKADNFGTALFHKAVGGQDGSEPWVIYHFPSREKARAALLSLGFIHQPAGGGEPISSKVLNYGYYQNDKGLWEAMVQGKAVTKTLFEDIRRAFAAAGGEEFRVVEPKRDAPEPKPAPAPPSAQEVKFLEKQEKVVQGQRMTYMVHKAPDAATAQAFLKTQKVTKPYYYLVVETPEGNYCLDNMGMYME